jgi:hypothetical protein
MDEATRGLCAQQFISILEIWSNQKQMLFSNKERGIIIKICNNLHLRQMYWWELNRKPILEALNQREMMPQPIPEEAFLW